MTATEIIKHISSETGLDFTGKESLNLVPLNDLHVHKTDVWSLTITHTPDHYFSEMTRQYKNKVGYHFKFPITDSTHGLALYKDLSIGFGISDIKTPVPQHVQANDLLYLAVHIHPEFNFTPKTNQAFVPTQELKLCFI